MRRSFSLSIWRALLELWSEGGQRPVDIESFEETSRRRRRVTPGDIDEPAAMAKAGLATKRTPHGISCRPT